VTVIHAPCRALTKYTRMHSHIPHKAVPGFLI
jgi:hypothetical protein